MKRTLLCLLFGCALGFRSTAQDVIQSPAQRNGTAAGTENQTRNAVPNSPKPEPALPAVLKLFDKFQVVGLSDLHGCAELLAFVEQLVQAPEFSAKVNDFTWELGNVRFQSLMDDFILRGKEIPFKELAQCWRNNTQVRTYSDTPALFHLLQTIRNVNLKLPEARRVRVLLLDPPIDWSKIQSKDEMRGKAFDRESHAVLFLGKRKDLTRVDPPGPDVLDAEWMSELKRRKALRGGPGGGLELKEKPHTRQFFSDDSPQGDRMMKLPLGKGAPGDANSLPRRKRDPQ